MGTAIGVQTKTYDRAKLKLIANRFGEEIIQNTSALALEKIGVDKNNSREYVSKICSLFGFNTNFREHFLSQIADHPEKVYAIIGQRSSSQLLINLTAEQLGTRHP